MKNSFLHQSVSLSISSIYPSLFCLLIVLSSLFLFTCCFISLFLFTCCFTFFLSVYLLFYFLSFCLHVVLFPFFLFTCCFTFFLSIYLLLVEVCRGCHGGSGTKNNSVYIFWKEIIKMAIHRYNPWVDYI